MASTKLPRCFECHLIEWGKLFQKLSICHSRFPLLIQLCTLFGFLSTSFLAFWTTKQSYFQLYLFICIPPKSLYLLVTCINCISRFLDPVIHSCSFCFDVNLWMNVLCENIFFLFCTILHLDTGGKIFLWHRWIPNSPCRKILPGTNKLMASSVSRLLSQLRDIHLTFIYCEKESQQCQHGPFLYFAPQCIKQRMKWTERLKKLGIDLLIFHYRVTKTLEQLILPFYHPKYFANKMKRPKQKPMQRLDHKNFFQCTSLHLPLLLRAVRGNFRRCSRRISSMFWTNCFL